MSRTSDQGLRETELKFTVPAHRVEAVRDTLRTGKVSEKRLQAEYFDTADQRLARHKASLRLRREGDRWVQTAKVTTDQATRRLEQNVAIPVPPDGRPALPDPTRHDGTALGKALRKALGSRRMQPSGIGLSARFGTDVERTARTVRVGQSKVEVALDIGRILSADRSLPVHELELELKAGDLSELGALAEQWVLRHGLWLNTASKGDRGRRLAEGDGEPAAVKARPPRFRNAGGSQAFFTAAVETCLRQSLDNASLVADGHASEEIVHQLRVGLRRLRTVLRELADIGSGIRPEWEPVLQRSFQELGRYRDQTVVVPAVRRELEGVDAPAFADPTPPDPPRPPTAVVRDPAFQTTMLALLVFADGLASRPATGKADGAAPALHAVLARRLDRLHDRIAHDGKRFARLDVARQHRVRKRLKRLRYLSELAAPVFGARKVGGYLSAWKAAQDALGEFNDHRIAAELFGASAPASPHAWFVVGWLRSRQDAAVEDCARALRKALGAEPFWR